MCGCEHHWDTSKPCTCTCPEHEGVRREMAHREAADIPDFVPDDIEQRPASVWIHPQDGGLMLITEEEAVAAIEKHGDYADNFVFFFAELTTDGV